MKRVVLLVTLACLTTVVVNISEARRVQTPSHQFFQGEPTKQLTIGVDFQGTIAFRMGLWQWIVREGMIDFLRELKTRGHKVILVTGSFYGECIKAVPELKEIVDGYRGKGFGDRLDEFDFIIDDDCIFLENAEMLGENPDKYFIIPAPHYYDYKNNPFGWADEIIELIQRAGG